VAGYGGRSSRSEPQVAGSGGRSGIDGRKPSGGESTGTNWLADTEVGVRGLGRGIVCVMIMNSPLIERGGGESTGDRGFIRGESVEGAFSRVGLVAITGLLR
jgi:hypothetical protein